MDHNNIHYYTTCLTIPPKYYNKNMKVKSDDPYIINYIKKIVDNIGKVKNQIDPFMLELCRINVKLPFSSTNPIILISSFTDMKLLEYRINYNHCFINAEKILPMNVDIKTKFKVLYNHNCLPIQLLDYISNFDSIFGVIYYKMLNDGNIHIFRISLDIQNQPYIDYKTSDKLLIDKLSKISYSGLNNNQVTEEFLKVVGHIFHSPAKSARN